MGVVSKDHPSVQALVQKMYEQRRQVGKISSFVGYLNMEYLKEELYKLGWRAKLKEDQETIELVEVVD